MKRLTLSFVIIFCSALFTKSTAQVVRRHGTTWVGLKSDQVFRLKGYQLKEDISGLTRTDYIKRKKDKKRILFYKHERGIVATLGHAGNLVLINDNQATKSNKVVVVNLDTNETKQIDLEAIKTYKHNASADARMIIVPEALAFSPNDKQVLVKMALIDISLPYEQRLLANRIWKSYKPWWYVVDSNTGHLVHEYRKKRPPKEWWI